MKSSNVKIAILALYVDVIITRNDHEEILNLKTPLATEFEIEDLESLRYILGMEVAQSKMVL